MHDPEMDGMREEDVLEAMRDMAGYLDITPDDLMKIYRFAYRRAHQRITRLVKAGEVMTREAAWVEESDSLARAAEVMARRKVSGLPVLRDGRVVGVVSERDFLARMGGGKGEGFMGVVSRCLAEKPCLAAPLKGAQVGRIMSAPAVTVGPQTPLWEVLEMFGRRGINRAPVVDGEGRLLGIVTRSDALSLAQVCPVPEVEP